MVKRSVQGMYVVLVGRLEVAMGGIDVTLDANSAVTSTSKPVALTVTTRNTGSDRVCWGLGSSSCQLGAVVRVEGRDVAVLGDGDCTDDLAELCLAPGDTRMEVFPWDGSILGENGKFIRLSQGAYRVRGTAGAEAYSAPVWISVENSQ
jgi:hypothetical protein